MPALHFQFVIFLLKNRGSLTHRSQGPLFYIICKENLRMYKKLSTRAWGKKGLAEG